MIEEGEVEVFWDVVKDCLEQIYGIGHAKAAAARAKLRRSVEQELPRDSRALFYHAEPIDVARDLAGKDKDDLSDVDWKKYDSILAHRRW